jgi:phage shock protein C
MTRPDPTPPRTAARPDDEHPGLYRSRDGLLLGVCRGLAEHLDVSVTGLRVVVVVLVLVTGFWPVAGLYVLAGVLLRPEPARPFATEEEEAFYQTYAHRHGAAVERLKRTYDRLGRRLAHLEHVVTSDEYQWRRRLDK